MKNGAALPPNVAFDSISEIVEPVAKEKGCRIP